MNTHPNPTPLVSMTIGQALRTTAAQWPDRPGILFRKPRWQRTWQAFDQEVDRVARGLIALGFQKGDHIAIWGTNVPEWLLTQLAVARIGAILITLNPEWKQAELTYALQQSDTRGLVMIKGFEKPGKDKPFVYDYLGTLQAMIPELSGLPEDQDLQVAEFPALRRIVIVDEQRHPGMMRWEDLIASGDGVSDATLHQAEQQVDAEDVAMIQYTSGTTGFPKGAMLTHNNTVNNARIATAHLFLSEEDRLCGPVPFYHCFGSILVNLGCVVSGATMVIPGPIFDPHNTLEAIAQERATVVYGVPTMFITELDERDFAAYDLSSLRTGIMAGAPVDKELFEAVTRRMGATEITIAYGLTETSPVTHQTYASDPYEKRHSTVGRPIEHTEAKIIDPSTLDELPDGEVGEIVVRGFHVMKGYYQKPEETAKTMLDGGWLRSGDLGIRDRDGYYRIVGRLKEMLIVGGHNVYPAEVEQALHSLLSDKVEMLQVVGIPHPKLQEVVGLAVKLHPGQYLTLEEVKARCEGNLEWPKIPRQLKIMDDFSPVMTVTGKIQKFKLRELLNASEEPV